MIQTALSCSLAIVFIYSCFQEGNVFGKVGHWAEFHLPGWLYKPLIGCLLCMAPWWGTAYYFIFDVKLNVIQFLFCVGGINAIVGAVLGYLKETTFFDNGK